MVELTGVASRSVRILRILAQGFFSLILCGLLDAGITSFMLRCSSRNVLGGSSIGIQSTDATLAEREG